MIQASCTTSTATDTALVTPQRWAITSRTFWFLLAFEALILTVVLLLVMPTLLHQRVPLASTDDYFTVRSAILARLDGTINDPLITVAPGLSARSSNVRGFTLNGNTYYYYVEGAQNFDPLSRAALQPNEVEIVLADPGSPIPLVIYRIVSK